MLPSTLEVVLSHGKTACGWRRLGLCAVLGAAGCAFAEEAPNARFLEYAEKLRAEGLQSLEPKVVPPIAPKRRAHANYPWKLNIVTAGFAIRRASAWDADWEKHYGGFDDPSRNARKDFRPAKFQPGLNPFYVALPYNDVSPSGTKPEARALVPWFAEAFRGDGTSVLRDRWVVVRKNLPNNTSVACYAQWSDCGPFVPDQGEYVFGNGRPRWNEKKGQGLCVSAAVRDFLKMQDMDVTDWKFVEVGEVPAGPWAELGVNNPLAAQRSGSDFAPDPK